MCFFSPHGQDVGVDLLLVPLPHGGRAEDEDAHDEVEQVAHGQRDQQLGEGGHALVARQPEHGEHVAEGAHQAHADQQHALHDVAEPGHVHGAQGGQGHLVGAKGGGSERRREGWSFERLLEQGTGSSNRFKLTRPRNCGLIYLKHELLYVFIENANRLQTVLGSHAMHLLK